MTDDRRCDVCPPDAPEPEALFWERIPGSEPSRYVKRCQAHFETRRDE